MDLVVVLALWLIERFIKCGSRKVRQEIEETKSQWCCPKWCKTVKPGRKNVFVLVKTHPFYLVPACVSPGIKCLALGKKYFTR